MEETIHKGRGGQNSCDAFNGATVPALRVKKLHFWTGYKTPYR